MDYTFTDPTNFLQLSKLHISDIVEPSKEEAVLEK
jgi:hypothetical protein